MSSPSLMRPIAMPATGALIGTPASIKARVEPQVEAMEEEPLDSMHLGNYANSVRKFFLTQGEQAGARAQPSAP